MGRIGVPNTLWDMQGPLTDAETERIRLHSYYTERVLARLPALAEIGQVAGSAHERLDGSGYHRGRGGADLPLTCRVLAAADCNRTSCEPRPHRAARSSDESATLLRRHASQGRSNAVLAQLGGGVQWVQSYVTGNRLFCVHNAESVGKTREHARIGGFPCDDITQVSGIIDPVTGGG